jgi:hypothetical protein
LTNNAALFFKPDPVIFYVFALVFFSLTNIHTIVFSLSCH